MTPAALYDMFREEMNDEVEPFLWSEALIWAYINDAEVMFARLTDGFADSSTPGLTAIAALEGQDTYVLSPLVLRVRSATYALTGRPLEVLNVEDMPGRKMFFDGRQNTPTAVILGQEPNKIRLWPTPAADIDLRLDIYRLPLLTITDRSAAFETPLQHHLELLDWVKHRAYLKQDAETFNRKKADEHEAAFRSSCAKAKQEQARRRFKPRVVAYGGL